MRKIILFYPGLFAINQCLIFFVTNLNDIPVKEVVLPIAISLLVTSGVWLVIARLFKDGQRASYLTLLIFLWFSNFGTLYQSLSFWKGSQTLGGELAILCLWSMFFGILGSTYVWRRIKKPQTITAYLSIVGLVVLCLLVYQYAQFKISGYDQAFGQDFPHPTLQAAQTPDIYYIILDGYARADVLEKVYRFDNTRFLASLQQRGFSIATASQSNYMHTVLSLASSLNLEYLPAIDSQVASDRNYLRRWLSEGAALRALQAAGYRPVVLPSGYLYTENAAYTPPNLDAHYRTRTGYLEWIWMVNSILYLGLEHDLWQSPIDHFADQQGRIIASADAVGAIAREPGPKFVFWHVIAPHPPFIFDSAGPITPGALYYLTDGTQWYGTPEVYMEGYLEQLTYINQLMVTTIDTILRSSAQPPIIVLQADHGGGAYLDFFSQDNTCLYERFGILNAYYLPGFEDEDIVYPSMTPVNTFRMIFNLYFGAELDYLEDAVYFSDFTHLYNFNNVTGAYPNDCSQFQK